MLNASKTFLVLICLIVSSIFVVTTRADEPSLMTPEALWKLGRIGEAVVSPDGSQIAYTVTRYDLAANEGKTDLIVGSLPKHDAASDKTAVAFDTPLVELKKQRTIVKATKGLNSVQWLSRGDSVSIVYIAPGTEEPNDPQIWMIAPDGGEAKQLTKIAGGVGNLKASPSGTHLAFTRDVKLDPTPQEIYPDLPKADARIIDSLMYRHWNAWHDYAYSHVHVAKVQDDGSLGEPVDLMAGLKFDCPLPPMGGADEFNFSPDGNELALTIKVVNNPAESTDSSVMLVDVEGGSLNNITVGMIGYDKDPVYSPDGRYIAFQSMERPGFEADRNRIMLYDRTNGFTEEISEGLDQTTHNIRWNEASDTLFFDSEYSGTQQAFSIAIHTRQVQQITKGTFNFQVLDCIPNSNRVLLTQQNMLRPAELAVVDITSRTTSTLTATNESFFSKLALPTVEERWVRASDGAHIHNWVILPPNFDASKKHPSLVFCQGGPQGQVGQAFSYRWNFHLMAAKGYVVLGVNRRGLPGFGQAWNDQISGDWGGQAMQDILAATDALLTEPYVDSKRVGAVGASFGGYTVYWLMGNAQDRFQAMIAHCGVFNLESMSGSTEELFFTNFDLGGPYWKSNELQEKYDAFSPHRFVGNWRTPLLVIHGEKDFRVPVTQGMEAFTAAQVQGVPSRFLYFPGEGHWVSKPQNSVLWQRVFFDWLETHLK
jgi:dipeptidyl aminopeptidase/acylaminoacyl peptidase